MSDIVLKLAIQPGAEAHEFGRYLQEFMERRASQAERMAAAADAPFMMIRADPAAGESAKIVIFQENRLAAAFYSGWSRRRERNAQAD